jgi:predicted membrane protein
MLRGLTIALILLFLTAPIAQLVLGDGFEDEEEFEEEWEGGFKKLARDAGSIAYILGLVLNSVFVMVRRAGGGGRELLNFHIVSNVVLAAVAMWHAAYFISEAGPLEYLIAILMFILIASGAVMRYLAHRRARLLSRMTHTQLAISIILAILIFIHSGLAEE